MHYQGMQGGTGFKGIPQLYAKMIFGEVCGKDRKFKTESEKQAVRKEAGGLAV